MLQIYTDDQGNDKFYEEIQLLTNNFIERW